MDKDELVEQILEARDEFLREYFKQRPKVHAAHELFLEVFREAQAEAGGDPRKVGEILKARAAEDPEYEYAHRLVTGLSSMTAILERIRLGNDYEPDWTDELILSASIPAGDA